MHGEAASARDRVESFGAFCRNWRTRLKDRLVHRLARRLWPRVLSVDEMSRDELLSLQQKSLERLLHHVVRHVPFYRRWAEDQGWREGDELRLEDFPIVTKDDYRRDLDAFQSEAYPLSSMSLCHTSGSTGVPLEVRAHIESTDYSYCCLWRALRRHGLRPGDRRVYVWGQRGRLEKNRLKRAETRARLAVRDWFNNTLVIDAADLGYGAIPRHVDRIEQYRPVYLHGFVSSLYAIARRMLADGRELRGVSLRAVITEAEQIEQFHKDVMHEAFGCPILEHFGAVEFGNIAQTDPDGHLRINEDMVLIEPQPSGEAAITRLLDHGFPFIRYAIGDMVEISPEVPGSLPYACISKILGRVADLVVLPGGDYFAGLELNKAVRPHDRYVRKYQIRQIDMTRFLIRIVPEQSIPESLQRKMVDDLREMVGAEAEVRVEIVDDIALEKTGKFRTVVSEIADAERAAALRRAGERAAR